MNGTAPSQNGFTNGNKKNVESFRHTNSKKLLRHRPLTPLRVLRGILCLVVLLLTALMMIVYWAPIATLAVRLFSVHYGRKTTSILFATWLSLWPFLFEKINRTKVIFSGDTVPEKERILLFANHRTEVDWMYIWDLALRKGRLGYIKYILKRSLMKLPIFGWGFQILEFISVERKWEIDEPIMRKKLSYFQDPKDPLWLVLFPEGTDYTEKKCIKSQEFAAANGLPILYNVLLPKSKGFIACLEALRNSLDAVYDVTITYKNHCPTFMDNVFGVDPSEVHIHVQRILLPEIPISENEASQWLIERFRLKDKLLSDFQTSGCFPNQGTEGDLSTLVGLINFFLVLTMTVVFVYCTFFLSVWFKFYVAFSCAYISILTYFDLQVTPILAFMKNWNGDKKNS